MYGLAAVAATAAAAATGHVRIVAAGVLAVTAALACACRPFWWLLLLYWGLEICKK
jgi:hypothetical protein